MKVAILKETYPGERRVALIPANIAQLSKAGLEVVIQSGAGLEAGFPDQQYEEKGASIAASRSEALTADIILQVRCLGANLEAGRDDLQHFHSAQIVIGSCDPLGAPEAIKDIAQTGATLFALEMVSRITRAQSMDILSSMATIAGYRAVLLAALELPKMFPMMMTAAGTLKAARVFILGVGVAGLQAIATARRLGAIVYAYDVRSECREQVESLGANFVELAIASDDSEDQGGYAKAKDEAYYQRQRELLAEVIVENDVIISTAAIPGRQSPLLITDEAVAGMQPGSVIIDLAAERGGNCQLSKPDQRVVEQGVVILGPTNLPSDTPNHASQMLSNNVTNLLLGMFKEETFEINLEDQVIHDTMAAHEGEVFNERIRGILGLEPLAEPETEADDESAAAEADSADDASNESNDEEDSSQKEE